MRSEHRVSTSAAARRAGSSGLGLARRAERFVLGVMVVWWVALLVACGPMTIAVGVSPGDQRLTTTRVDGDPGLLNRRVALIDISGMIVNAERPGLLSQGEHPVGYISEQLARAGRDSRVEAVILRLNTPGGTVTASDAVYREVRRFRKETGKPVVALLMDVAASGGYYVACAADEIITYPTAVTGSVGVILQTVTFQPALSRLGIESEAFTSGPNKVAGSPLSPMTEEHRQVLQGLVDDFHGRFVAVVRQARPGLDEATFDRVNDGRVVSGAEAVRMGLADAEGDLASAFARAKELAGLERADLVRFHRPLRYVGSAYASEQAVGEGGTQVNLMQLNVERLPGVGQSPAGLYYLWRPDVY